LGRSAVACNLLGEEAQALSDDVTSRQRSGRPRGPEPVLRSLTVSAPPSLFVRLERYRSGLARSTGLRVPRSGAALSLLEQALARHEGDAEARPGGAA